MSTRDLRSVLLDHAVDLTRASGPDSVSLREVQRRAGVSPAAAYRHYRDRDALLVAVGRRASAALADHISGAQHGVDDPVARLRAGCRGYVDFAVTEPGLFRAVLLTHENPADLVAPQEESIGFEGEGPFQQLRTGLAEAAAALGGEVPDGSDTAVWAACHGLAVLLLDGPLRHLDPVGREAVTERLLDVVVAGVLAPGPADLGSHRVRE